MSSVGGATEREKGEERGWVRPWGCHAARGLASTGGRRMWAACRCSDRGAPGADGRAPVAVRAGREQRGTTCQGHVV
jgi:hypothetical protein